MAGFRPRWEVDPAAPGRPRVAAGDAGDRRPARRVRRLPAVPDAAPGEDGAAPGAPDAGGPPFPPAGPASEEGAQPLPGEGGAVVSTVLEPPRAAAGPAGQGSYVSIDFETFPDGSAVCVACPVDDEWRRLGLDLSFRSWSAETGRPYILDSGNFVPEGASRRALGPALDDERGLEVGVIRLDFPGRPRRVAFTLYGPDLIETFEVAAWSGESLLGPDAITRTVESRYRPAGRAVFRAERVLVESARGIDRVSLDGWGPPGHVLLVDDLAIDP